MGCRHASGGRVLPDLSVFWVIFLRAGADGVLNRLLLQPLQRVMGEREQAIRSARELAERSAAEARAAAAEFDQKTSVARAEIYRQMDEMRKPALDRARRRFWPRPAPRPRPKSPARVATLKAEADEARRRLSADAEALGIAAADRILGRKAS